MSTITTYPDWTRAQICLVARAILDICKKPGPGALEAIASLAHTIEVNTKRDLDGMTQLAKGLGE